MSAWSLVFGGSAVIAAHKTGLLDALLSGSRTSEELGAELGLDQTAMERVIDVLHVVGLAHHVGDSWTASAALERLQQYAGGGLPTLFAEADLNRCSPPLGAGTANLI